MSLSLPLIETTSPEAFDVDFKEFNEAAAEPWEPEPEQTVEQEQEAADEWDKFWSRFDFPFEGGE